MKENENYSMNKKVKLALIVVMFPCIAFCQTSRLIVPDYINIPGDSIHQRALLTSIDAFLSQLNKSAKENSQILKSQLLATSVLKDELNGMSDYGPDKPNFFQCYISNVMLLNDSDYLIQIQYRGIFEKVPVLRAGFTVIAKKSMSQYLVSSPLVYHTRYWKSKTNKNFVILSNSQSLSPLEKRFIKKANEFDKKLGVADYITKIYYCDDFPSALQLIGVDYKLDYNSINHNDLVAFEADTALQIIGNNESDAAQFDIHDLWHSRLHHLIPVAQINKSVDEGCAYLYGGSWGQSWKSIFQLFKKKFPLNSDWLTLFNKNENFANDKKHPLYPSYVINALIVQDIEKKRGFKPVLRLLKSGNEHDEKVSYFNVLKQIASIDQLNFNLSVDRMIVQE